MTNPRKEYHKTYNSAKYKANKAHFQEVSREYYRLHPEEHKARMRAYRLKLKLNSVTPDKELARWIYYEGNIFYCAECCEKRLSEINKNKEFNESIDYENGDECGYYEDYADDDEAVYCCKCDKPLFSKIDC